MPVRLFVGNLPYDATEAELREHFSAVGRVSYLSLPTDRESGRLRGFAFVEFSDNAHAEEAIRRFHNQSFKGRPIAVSVARPREDRPPGDGPSRSSAPRTNAPRLALNTDPDPIRPPTSGGKQNREFGPDASPRKVKTGPRPERAQKGPMREQVRGQFFGGDDDIDDFDDDLDDFYPDDDDLDEENTEEEANEANVESLANHLINPIGKNSQ